MATTISKLYIANSFFIGYNIINYPDPDYEYEDYDILYVYKENNEWKIRYGGE